MVRLFARGLLEAVEQLYLGVEFDHVKQRELTRRALRACCSESERSLAFRRLVHHHEEFSLMALNKALTLLPSARLCGRLILLGRLFLCHRIMLPLAVRGCPGRKA